MKVNRKSIASKSHHHPADKFIYIKLSECNHSNRKTCFQWFTNPFAPLRLLNARRGKQKFSTESLASFQGEIQIKKSNLIKKLFCKYFISFSGRRHTKGVFLLMLLTQPSNKNKHELNFLIEKFSWLRNVILIAMNQDWIRRATRAVTRHEV